MTNYIVPSSAPMEEELNFTGIDFPCRVTDLRTGEEYILESEEAIPIVIAEPRMAGTTALRPERMIASGVPYFDTDLNKPIWFSGVGWVDAAGVAVA